MVSVLPPSSPPPQARPIMLVSVLPMSLESQVAYHLCHLVRLQMKSYSKCMKYWFCLCIDGSSSFSHSVTFDNCMISLICTYQSSEGQCFIQYGQDPSYQDLSLPIQGPLNSPFTLPLMDENTFYHYLVNNTFGILFTGNFTTGECEIV